MYRDHRANVPSTAIGIRNSNRNRAMDPLDEVLVSCQQFRAQSIRRDAIYLDIDYMNGYRVFTWDAERFADPAGLIRALREQQMRIVTIIDPGVKVDPTYTVYQEGLAKGRFRAISRWRAIPGLGLAWAELLGRFFPGDVRAWWGELHRGLIEVGVAGIWNYMNEPVQAGIFAPPGISIPHGAPLPDDALHGAPDDTITHAQFHNAYGLEMGQATYEGLRQLRPTERPFVLTRAATAGSQRYAIVWNGDSTSSWDNLRLAIPLNLGVSLSGFPMTGGDVGGFWQDATAELLVRWTQLGALLPFCRNHSAAGTVRQEPWAFGEPYTQMCRAALERRYQLLPYMLTLAHEATLSDAPSYARWHGLRRPTPRVSPVTISFCWVMRSWPPRCWMKAPHRGNCCYHRENGLLGKAPSCTLATNTSPFPSRLRHAATLCTRRDDSAARCNCPIDRWHDRSTTDATRVSFPRQPSGNG